jgi:hypothetical protein
MLDQVKYYKKTCVAGTGVRSISRTGYSPCRRRLHDAVSHGASLVAQVAVCSKRVFFDDQPFISYPTYKELRVVLSRDARMW